MSNQKAQKCPNVDKQCAKKKYINNSKKISTKVQT